MVWFSRGEDDWVFDIFVSLRFPESFLFFVSWNIKWKKVSGSLEKLPAEEELKSPKKPLKNPPDYLKGSLILGLLPG